MFEPLFDKIAPKGEECAPGAVKTAGVPLELVRKLAEQQKGGRAFAELTTAAEPTAYDLIYAQKLAEADPELLAIAQRVSGDMDVLDTYQALNPRVLE
jgi:hypothetical protein